MADPTVRTHYQVLGVSPGASADEIRRAHRQLARVMHPDRQSDATDAERRFADRRMREVNAAWTVVSDPVRRRAYDAELRAARTGPGSAGSSGAASNGARTGSGSGSSGPAARPRPGPGSSRQPYVAPEDSVDPDAAYAQMRLDELDPNEPQLTAAHFWLLRRGPVVLIVLVGLFLFVVTAYAGTGSGGGAGTSTTSTTAPPDCVRVVENRSAIAVPCTEPNDGRILTQVRAALDCPERTRYVLMGSEFFCVSSDPSVTASTPTVIGG